MTRINCSDIESHGIIIVKPHALELGLHDPILRFLSGEKEITELSGIKIRPETIQNLSKIHLCSSFISDFGTKREIIETIYGKEKDKPHYEILMKEYSGKAMICLFGYKGNHEELQLLLKDLKGRAHVIDNEGKTIYHPHGIRGKLLSTDEFISEKELDELDKNEYQKRIRRMVNNIIHTTDSQDEVFAIIRNI